MKQERVVASYGHKFAYRAAVLLAVGTWAVLLFYPLNHDVAWLLEATRRWLGGERLYSAIVEINPPLIFIEQIVLTAGQLTKPAYLAGICVVAMASAFWIARWHGPRSGLIVAAGLLLPAVSDFGQRDHLALIFLTPYLLAPENLSRRERVAIGAWAFLGVGLKPFFAAVPALFVAAKCVMGRSWRPVVEASTLTLGFLCLALVAAVALIWPHYFTELIPLGRKVYGFYGGVPGLIDLGLALVILLVGGTLTLRRRQIGYAVLATLLVYFMQGKFWHYQFVPPLALAAIGCLLERGWLRLIGGLLLSVGPILGPNQYSGPAIPRGVGSVFSSPTGSAPHTHWSSNVACGTRAATRLSGPCRAPGAVAIRQFSANRLMP